MTLNESSKAALCGNIHLIKFCEDNSISIKKLSRCRVDKIYNLYGFVADRLDNNGNIKNTEPVTKEYLLEHGVIIGEPAQVALYMEYNEQTKEFEFKVGEYVSKVKEQ